MPDHIHIPSRLSVASFIGYLKGKSVLMTFYKYANLKYKFGNQYFWCRERILYRYSRKNAKTIKEYIQNQLKQDLEYA